jgi:outer membrane protein OmpA-like peptidoglycan-associated protein
MAQLDVQPKSSTPWWVWLLAAIFAVLALLLLFKGCNKTDTTAVKTDTTNVTIAVTQPDFNTVDFNAPVITDADITDKDIIVNGNDEYTMYTLGENILFATDQNALQGSADAKLKQIATSLKKRFGGAYIAVYGNTDSTGTGQHNADLGGWRASAVKNWLVSNGGIDANKVSLHTFGESKPVASNATASGRQQNRNVQIVAIADKK